VPEMTLVEWRQKSLRTEVWLQLEMCQHPNFLLRHITPMAGC
jgi:hypothetical protein